MALRITAFTIEKPFEQADLDAKFRDCCEGFLSPSAFEGLRGALRGIQDVQDVHEVTRFLKFTAAADAGGRFLARYAAE